MNAIKFLAVCSMLLVANGMRRNSVYGQSPDEPAELPAEYASELATVLQVALPAEFIERAGELWSRAQKNLKGAALDLVRDGVRSRAKVWLLESDAISTLSIQEAGELKKWGVNELNADDRMQLLQQIDAIYPGLGQMTFEQLDDRMLRTRDILESSYENLLERHNYVVEWISTRDVSLLPDSQIDRLIYYIHPLVWPQDGVDVKWTGWVTPPRAGTYVFSISPLQISTTYGRTVHEQSMTVDVDGQRVISTDHKVWKASGRPVTLNPGRVRLDVHLRYSHTSGAHARLAMAQLSWQGPGVSPEVVPASALTHGDSEPGLEAECRWKHRSGNEVVDSQIVTNIDQQFFQSTLCGYDEVFQQLVDERLTRLCSADAFGDLVEPSNGESDGEADVHPFFRRKHNHRRLLQYCSSARRREIAHMLMDHPESFAKAWPRHAFQVYIALRPGAEREAIDVLGMWMLQNESLLPRLEGLDKRSFYSLNRRHFRGATIGLVWEHAESAQWLERDYLETEDGRCSLPAAYTLAYGYLVQNRMYEWIAILEEKLADESVTGDRRVNWLLARAHAEEIRFNPNLRHYFRPDELGRGDQWIDEARLVAETEPTIYRANLEAISRQAARGNLGSAVKALENLQASLTDPLLSAEVEKRRGEVQAIIVERLAHKARSEAEVRESYQRAVQRQLALAQERNDTASAGRLQSILQKIDE